MNSLRVGTAKAVELNVLLQVNMIVTFYTIGYSICALCCVPTQHELVMLITHLCYTTDQAEFVLL